MAHNLAVVLLSGGLDSAVTLYLARKSGFKCSCIIFDYGQRHRREIEFAKRIAHSAKCKYRLLKLSMPWKGSALLDKRLKVRQGVASGIPATYVPGRNIIFLSLALSYAEASEASSIFIGAHSEDYSGYPDCRPEFFHAFEKVVACGTKAGVEKKPIRIRAPLLHKNKAEIIRLGARLGVPFALTWSCYRGGNKPCGHCDSCHFRAKGFSEASLPDPLLNRDVFRSNRKSGTDAIARVSPGEL